MRNNNGVSAPIMVMGLIAVQFIDVSAPGRCGPYDRYNTDVKTKRNNHEAQSRSFEEHLREHAKLRVLRYLEVVMVSNMCIQYKNLEFKDIFKVGANYQDTSGLKQKNKDITQVDANGLKLPGTTAWTFGNTHAAHVVGLGLKHEKLNHNCPLRENLGKMISRTTEQVAEVNLNIDRQVDRFQLNFGINSYKGDKKIEERHFTSLQKSLKKVIKAYKMKKNLKLNANGKSRFEFYADTYLDVIRNLKWRDICQELVCEMNDKIAVAEQSKWTISKNVLGKCH